MNFNETQLLLLNAKSPEEVFPNVDSLTNLRRAFRQLSAVVHPDVNPNNQVDADAAFKRLQVWDLRAKGKLREGSWRDGKPWVAKSFHTRTGFYEISHLERQEALFDTLSASLDGVAVQIHVPRKPSSDLLVHRAVTALRQVGGFNKPTLIDVLDMSPRTFYVTNRPPNDAAPLAYHMNVYPGGMKPSRAIPHIDRLLCILAQVREAGLVHAAVNSETFWVQPSGLGYLVDWHYSVPLGGIATVINATHADCVPWEIRDHKPTDRGTDLAAAMLLLLRMLGAEDMPDALRHLIYDHMREGRARPNNIEDCRLELRRIYHQL